MADRKNPELATILSERRAKSLGAVSLELTALIKLLCDLDVIDYRDYERAVDRLLEHIG